MLYSLILPFLGIMFIINNKSTKYDLTVSLLMILPSFILSLYNMILPMDISYLFILLTTFIIPISLISSINRKDMMISILIIDIILIIAFSSLDLWIWYISFEIVLIPMFILITNGSGINYTKSNAVYRLILYTLFGGLFLLIGLLILYINVGESFYWILILTPINPKLQLIIFPLFLISYLIKLPAIPFHLWLPIVHVEAPTSGSIILAALLLKLGGFGIIRWVFPILPYATLYYAPLLGLIATISIIYGSLITLRQIDIKKLIAYSSVAHLGVVLLGLSSLNYIAWYGSILLMIIHGIVSAGLFFSIGIIYERFGTRLIYYYRGLTHIMPLYTLFFFILTLSNIALPPTVNFISELLIFVGTFKTFPIYTILSAFTILLSASYSIWLFNRIAFGPINSNYIINMSLDITRREYYILLPLTILTIILLGLIN
jgi:proton-translocating NADH-quinone oxidoreductase chain M